jgi:hypothetical protein
VRLVKLIKCFLHFGQIRLSVAPKGFGMAIFLVGWEGTNQQLGLEFRQNHNQSGHYTPLVGGTYSAPAITCQSSAGSVKARKIDDDFQRHDGLALHLIRES